MGAGICRQALVAHGWSALPPPRCVPSPAPPPSPSRSPRPMRAASAGCSATSRRIPPSRWTSTGSPRLPRPASSPSCASSPRGRPYALSIPVEHAPAPRRAEAPVHARRSVRHRLRERFRRPLHLQQRVPRPLRHKSVELPAHRAVRLGRMPILAWQAYPDRRSHADSAWRAGTGRYSPCRRVKNR
jgi:hypothetical protein